MNEKIEEIEIKLLKNMNVSLTKQCKNEYIVYTFFTNSEKENIIYQTKNHYVNRDMYIDGDPEGLRTGKVKEVIIPIRTFLNDTVYDLINRGYELETYSYVNNL